MRLSASLAVLFLFVGAGSTAAQTLTVTPTTVAPGGTVSVVVAGGPANPRDWVALCLTTASDTGHSDWKYLNGSRTAPTTGLAGATITFTMPTTAGTYNFRFFSNNTYTKLATSATVTVQSGGGGPTLSVSTTSAAPGQSISVTVANGPGAAKDWVGLHLASAPDATYSDWKYLNGTRTAPTTGLTAATFTFTLPSTAGTYNFRLYRATSNAKVATSANVTVSAGAAISVNTTTVSAGGNVVVTVSGGPGSTSDWVGLHTASGADTTYSDWKYLSGTRTKPATGLTGASLTFAMPTSPGTYNFRFFRGAGNVKLATSATVTVQSSGTPALSVTPLSVFKNETVTVTVSGGPANRGDWVGMFASGASDGSKIKWNYLNGTQVLPASGQASATLTFAMPSATGTYNFRFFNVSNVKLATSATVTVKVEATPTLVASATTAGTQQPVSATLTGGPGGPPDWIGLFATTAADGTFIDWKYLNGSTTTQPNPGRTSATLTFMTPSQPGSYHFRFFRAGNVKLATSGTFTTTGSSSLVPTPLSVAPGQTITVAASGGSGSAKDWVGIHANPGADTSPIDWKYMSGTRTAPPSWISGANLTFTAPATPGTYNFRYFKDGGYTKLATSVNVTVQGNAPVFSINDVTVTEGNAGTVNATFTISISASPTQNATVDYATANGTATSGSDYVPTSSSKLLFVPGGATSRTISVPVRGDDDVEPNEYFVVNLSNPFNAAIGDAQGRATITNDDQGPPPQPTLLSPTGSISTATPQYRWNALSGATEYLLVVFRPRSAPVIQQTYLPAAACTASVCSVTPTTALGRGAYKWTVQGRNVVGPGAFSLPMSFTVNAGAASVVTITSHDSGQRVQARGFLVSGTATDPGGVTGLTATLDDPILGRTVDARPLDVASGSGRWAFWVREGQVTAGETITASLTATYGGGQTSTSTLTLLVVATDMDDYRLLNRITFGATPELLERLAAVGPAAFRDEQLSPTGLDDSALTARLTGMPRTTKAELQAYALTRMMFSRRQLLEVMTQFWDNHFSTDINKTNNVAWESSETDLFRQNALGKFRDLLDVSSTSPAMMVYLDNATSLKAEANENYARELMELHTMGVDGGYSQRDVENVARAFTGWGVSGNAFFFDPNNHNTSQKTVLGNTLPSGRGIEDGRQVLDILTAHPSTARFICKKLIRLFVSDTPPQSLWDGCAATFASSEGDISDVVRLILTSPEFGAAQYLRAKVKTPLELITSFVRATDATTSATDLTNPMGDMGMRVYEKDEPTGWSETGDDWINSNLLLERASWVNSTVRRTPAAGRTTVSLKSFFSANGYETAEGIVGYLFDVALHHEFTDLDRQVALDILSPSGQPAFDFNAPEADARLQRLVGTVLSYPGYQVQ